MPFRKRPTRSSTCALDVAVLVRWAILGFDRHPIRLAACGLARMKDVSGLEFAVGGLLGDDAHHANPASRLPPPPKRWALFCLSPLSERRAVARADDDLGDRDVGRSSPRSLGGDPQLSGWWVAGVSVAANSSLDTIFNTIFRRHGY